MNRDRSETGYWLAFAALAITGFYFVLANKYLPMVDLPGHVAQLALIQRSIGGEPLPPGFEWNPVTPYLFGYFLTFLLGLVVPVTMAVKIVLGAYIVSTPLAVRFLLRTLGSETWWSLLFFVGVFCHPFYWGFYPHLVATPIGVVTLAASIRARDEPTFFWRIAAVGLSLLLLVSHVIVFLVVLGLFGAYLLADWTSRRPPRELLLWLPAGVGFTGWFIFFYVQQPVREGRWVWDLGVHRLLQLASGVAGDARDTQIGWYVYGGLLLLGLVAGFKFRFRRGSLALFGSALLLLVSCPSVAGGIAHLSWRLSFWVFLGFFALVSPMASGRRARIARATTVAVLFLAMGWIGTELHQFDQEASTVDPMLAAMAEEKKLHPLIFDFRGNAGPSASYVHSYLHFGGWYFVEKQGLYAGMFRFAPRHLPIIRSRPLFGENWQEDAAYWSEARFDVETAGDYDYYLLRQVNDDYARKFLADQPTLEEIDRSGPWHLLRRVAPDH